MGDDHLSSRPFHFFSDYDGEIADAIRANRPREAERFGGFPRGMRPEDIADPNDRATFTRSKVAWDHAHTPEVSEWQIFLADLLAVRKKHVVPCLAGAEGYASSVVPSEDTSVFIDWRMPGGLLRLRANLSQESQISTPASANSSTRLGLIRSATASKIGRPARRSTALSKRGRRSSRSSRAHPRPTLACWLQPRP
jgi:1,4-alpha-glucan branching enzyme